MKESTPLLDDITGDDEFVSDETGVTHNGMIQSVGRQAIDGDDMFAKDVQQDQQEGECSIQHPEAASTKFTKLDVQDHPPACPGKGAEGYILDADSGKYYNSDTGYYYDPETDLHGDAATGVWYKCKNGGFEPV